MDGDAKLNHKEIWSSFYIEVNCEKWQLGGHKLSHVIPPHKVLVIDSRIRLKQWTNIEHAVQSFYTHVHFVFVFGSTLEHPPLNFRSPIKLSHLMRHAYLSIKLGKLEVTLMHTKSSHYSCCHGFWIPIRSSIMLCISQTMNLRLEF